MENGPVSTINMKKLILVRHGKSSWKEDLPDDERPLKKRAYKDADLVIKAFSGFKDDQMTIWSSYAVRALTTAKLFKEGLNIPDSRFEVKDELYTFNYPVVLWEHDGLCSPRDQPRRTTCKAIDPRNRST